MEFIVLWIALAIVVGVAANTRGRSGGGWFLLALIISPLVAGLPVLALPSKAATVPPTITLVPSKFRNQLHQQIARKLRSQHLHRQFSYQFSSLMAPTLADLIKFNMMEVLKPSCWVPGFVFVLWINLGLLPKAQDRICVIGEPTARLPAPASRRDPAHGARCLRFSPGL